MAHWEEFKRDYSGREAKPLVAPLSEGAGDLFQNHTIRGNYPLKPHEFVLVQTKESFPLPNHFAGHIRPRTTLNKLGLILTVQHINPSFEGYLWLGFYTDV